jgi:hypothetical protein
MQLTPKGAAARLFQYPRPVSILFFCNRRVYMNRYSHQFVEIYQGPVAFGLSRELDESSLIVYLQKFSDDRLMEVLRSRLSNEEILHTIDWITGLLRRHFTEEEYHRLFLREQG